MMLTTLPRWGALLLLAATPAWAGADPATEVLAGPCANCHGPDGRSDSAIPAIAGRSAAVLQAQMMGFRDGSEPATVMGRLMKGYDDAQIAALAEWFAGVAK